MGEKKCQRQDVEITHICGFFFFFFGKISFLKIKSGSISENISNQTVNFLNQDGT